MGDANPIRTHRDYSRPSHEGYMNTIELLEGNNVVHLRSDTIRNPHNDKPEEDEQEGNDDLENINTNPSPPPDSSVSFITKKVCKLNSFFELLGLVPQSSNIEFVCTKGDDDDVMFIKIIKHDNDLHIEEPEVGKNARVGESGVEYFDIFPTRSELAYHKYLMCGPIPSIFLRNPIITEGCLLNLKVPCNIGHVHVVKAYIEINSPLNLMTQILYNWIMRRKLDLRESTNRGVNNFIGRIKGMHVFVGNFTYVIDFMIIEDISSIIDPSLSQVVLGRPFVEISNMTHDPPDDVIRSRSIAIIWLEKVVTPLIDPAIKGFAAAPAALKPERLKVDKTRYE
nr:MAK10-like protein [Tanacetum cinerariifolium]